MENQSISDIKTPSQLIDERIEELGDWRGIMLSKVRDLMKQTNPEIVEECKWRGTPVWSHEGMICTGETYKNVVKLTFAKGASLEDPSQLFNSSLEGNARRAIDIHEGEELKEEALKALIRDAIALNMSSMKPSRKKKVEMTGELTMSDQNISDDSMECDIPQQIGKPAQRALTQAGLYKLEQLTKIREADLIQLHGIGPKAILILKQALAAEDKSFIDQKEYSRER